MFVNTLTLTLNSDTELSNSESQQLRNSETRCLGDLKNLSQSRKETQRNYLLLITHCSRLIAKITPHSQLIDLLSKKNPQFLSSYPPNFSPKTSCF